MKAIDIEMGYHPNGFRIDKTTTPMNRYTQWMILDDGAWADPRPVCFHALPKEGWVVVTHLDWPETPETTPCT